MSTMGLENTADNLLRYAIHLERYRTLTEGLGAALMMSKVPAALPYSGQPMGSYI